MSVATFDTLKFANTLKAAGVPDKQAEAEAAALSEALQVNLKEVATREDLKLTKDELRADIAHLRDLMKWMVGVVIAILLPILIRLFLWRGPIA